jgi:hypothetical protein
VWLPTTHGKKAPVDFASLYDADREWLEREGGTLVFDPKRMLNHFATCPQAKQWKPKNSPIPPRV